MTAKIIAVIISRAEGTGADGGRPKLEAGTAPYGHVASLHMNGAVCLWKLLVQHGGLVPMHVLSKLIIDYTLNIVGQILQKRLQPLEALLDALFFLAPAHTNHTIVP